MACNFKLSWAIPQGFEALLIFGLFAGAGAGNALVCANPRLFLLILCGTWYLPEACTLSVRGHINSF